MYLHLGNDIVVRIDEIIGIFDIENTSIGKYTRDYLKRKTDEKRVYTVSYEMPKSFIVCMANGKEEVVYISQISCSTLKKRMYKLKKFNY